MTKEELRERIDRNLKELSEVTSAEVELRAEAALINGKEVGLRNRAISLREQIKRDLVAVDAGMAGEIR